MDDIQFDIYHIQDILNMPKHDIETEDAVRESDMLLSQFETCLSRLHALSGISGKLAAHGLSPAFREDYAGALEAIGVTGSQAEIQTSLEGLTAKIIATLKTIIVKLITFFRNNSVIIRMTDVNEVYKKQMATLIAEKEYKYPAVSTAAFASASGRGFDYDTYMAKMHGLVALVDKLKSVRTDALQTTSVVQSLEPYLKALGFQFQPKLSRPDVVMEYRDIVYSTFKWDPTRVHSTTETLFSRILLSNIACVKLRNTATAELAKSLAYLKDPDLAASRKTELDTVVANCRALRLIILHVSELTSMLVRQWISMVRQFVFA